MSSSFNLPFIKLLPFIDYLVTFIDVFINSVKNIFTVTFFYLKKLFLYLQILGIPNLYPQFKLGTITFLYGYHKHFFFFLSFPWQMEVYAWPVLVCNQREVAVYFGRGETVGWRQHRTWSCFNLVSFVGVIG